MNPFTDILFTIIWFGLLVWAVRTMAKGWSLMTQPMNSNDVKFDVKTKQITRPPHPELKDVEPGDELLVVNFTPDDEFNRRVKESDTFLNQSLKERIEELEGDDDDDGDVPAVVRR
jgi:hypothetical protein